MFAVRAFDYSQADYQAYIALQNAVWPDQPASLSYEQRQDAQRLPEHLFERLLLELPGPGGSGALVAAAEFGHTPWSFDPHRFYVRVFVHPDHRRRGIGGRLYDLALDRLSVHNPAEVEGAAREDQSEGIRFLTQRGFEQVLRLEESEMDPAAFDGERFAGVLTRVQAAGITIKTLRELASDADYVRKLYDLEVELEQDVPWHDDITAPPFEQWCKSYQDNPDLLPDAYQVALDGDRYIGLSQLWASQATDAILYTGFTGVHREYRRRRIATALKVRAIEYAQRQRAADGRPPVIRTGNEENNPMYQLNLQLGFRPRPAWLVHLKRMGGAPGSRSG